MERNRFDPALSQVFGSQVRSKLVAVLVERREDWLTAAELCNLADVSQSGFHRDHKSVLLDFGLVERRNGDSVTDQSPRYALADTEQADHVANLHYALQSQLENSGPLLEGDVEQFVK